VSGGRESRGHFSSRKFKEFVGAVFQDYTQLAVKAFPSGVGAFRRPAKRARRRFREADLGKRRNEADVFLPGRVIPSESAL
jgi:hypothetical protein